MNDSLATAATAATAHRLVERLLATADAFRSRLEAALAEADLSMAKLALLRILSDAGEPVALGELAEHSGCVRSNITQLVDRLEKDGLVRRILDPADRRIRRAELTEAGRRSHAAGVRILAVEERALVGGLGEADRQALFVAMEGLRTCAG